MSTRVSSAALDTLRNSIEMYILIGGRGGGDGWHIGKTIREPLTAKWPGTDSVCKWILASKFMWREELDRTWEPQFGGGNGQLSFCLLPGSRN